MQRFFKTVLSSSQAKNVRTALVVICVLAVCGGGILLWYHIQQERQEVAKQEAQKAEDGIKHDKEMDSRYKELKVQIDMIDTRVTFSFHNTLTQDGDLENIEGCLRQERTVSDIEKKLDTLEASPEDLTYTNGTKQDLSELRQAVQVKREELTKNVRAVLEQELADVSDTNFGGVPLSHRSLVGYQNRLKKLPQYVNKLSKIVGGASKNDTWKGDFLKRVDASTTQINSALDATPMPPKFKSIDEDEEDRKNYSDVPVTVDLPYATFLTTKRAAEYSEFGHAHYWKWGVAYDEYKFLSKASFYIEEDGSGRSFGGELLTIIAVPTDAQIKDALGKESRLTSDGKYQVLITFGPGETMGQTVKIK